MPQKKTFLNLNLENQVFKFQEKKITEDIRRKNFEKRKPKGNQNF